MGDTAGGPADALSARPGGRRVRPRLATRGARPRTAADATPATLPVARSAPSGTQQRTPHPDTGGAGAGQPPALSTAPPAKRPTPPATPARAGRPPVPLTDPGAEEHGPRPHTTGSGTGTGTDGGGEQPTAPSPTPRQPATPTTALPAAPARPAVAEAGWEAGGFGQVVPSSRFLAKATLLTASLSVAAALLGLLRDQSLARLFGAGQDTDAFLVAWTVPEFAATLLIEDGLAFALVPAFSMALARRAQGVPGDPVRSLVAATLPRLCLAFAAVGTLLALAAPQFVAALAPGLPDPGLAVDCTRIASTCVLSFGLAGYCSAALRAHGRFLAPAAIYIAYNVGIVTAMYALGGSWGVRSAAFGVAAGGCLMVLAQLPSLLRQLGRHRRSGARPVKEAGAGARPMAGPLLATVLLFALCRQSQVLVERFLASSLPAGAISHLNYAQKVAQIPMTLSMMLCTVTFPVVARALAEGDAERARVRVERDLAVAAALVLLGTAAVMACAPQLIQLLFQRGAFTAGDTAATAGVMRVYALGLLGQTLTGVLVRSYFSAGRATWYPVAAMTAGIAVTTWMGARTVGAWGVTGIAAANAAGITLTAALLLAGMRRRSVPVRTGRVLHELSRPVGAAAGAALAGGLAARLPASPLAGLAVGGTTVAVAFALLGRALGVQDVAPALRFLRTHTRRLAHALLR
ncbi:lipid II flippase MurJ [Streptomyces sp. NPDC096012]|uniref:murein biosynthesis integral membrane protein MurJ n=1 Tax=Streptomyces sp. NPDC096012 TaxID=3155684 RepID=UPI00336A23C3